MTHITIITKTNLDLIPPIISIAKIINSMGYPVHIICTGINQQIGKEFASNGITISIVPRIIGKNLFLKCIDYLNFRLKVKKITQTKNSLYWIEGAHTLLALGKDFLKHRDYFLQLSELHEDDNHLKRIINFATKHAKKIFMPEYNRCAIFKIWYKLYNRPILLPNKPYFLPTINDLKQYSTKYSRLVELSTKKKIILYQGYIGKGRDISSFVRIVNNIKGEFALVLMGHDCGIINEFKTINPEIEYLDFIPAPEYLFITSLAYIGILSYNDNSLNNIFCAPNKLYEYASYNLPMIGNDIPGLKMVFDNYKIGITCNYSNDEDVTKAILDIDANYTDYKRNVTAFNMEVDNVKTIQNSLQQYENNKC